jgi:hypothetical protein
MQTAGLRAPGIKIKLNVDPCAVRERIPPLFDEESFPGFYNGVPLFEKLEPDIQ